MSGFSKDLTDHLRALPDRTLSQVEVGLLCDEVERLQALRVALRGILE